MINAGWLRHVGIVMLILVAGGCSSAESRSIIQLGFNSSSGRTRIGDVLPVDVYAGHYGTLDRNALVLESLSALDASGTALQWNADLYEVMDGPHFIALVDAAGAAEPVKAIGRITYMGKAYVLDMEWRRYTETFGTTVVRHGWIVTSSHLRLEAGGQ